MFTFIKRWMLKSKLAPTSAIKTTDVNPMKKACVLYDASSQDNRDHIARWLESMKQKTGMTISSLGYYHSPTPLGHASLPTYCSKEVNWYGMPSGPSVDEFLAERYDICFVVIPSLLPHFEYIISHTKARLKATDLVLENEAYCDFIVDQKNNVPIDARLEGIIKMIDIVAVK